MALILCLAEALAMVIVDPSWVEPIAGPRAATMRSKYKRAGKIETENSEREHATIKEEQRVRPRQRRGTTEQSIETLHDGSVAQDLTLIVARPPEAAGAIAYESNGWSMSTFISTMAGCHGNTNRTHRRRQRYSGELIHPNK